MLTNPLFQANRQTPNCSSAKLSTPAGKVLRKFEHKINLGEYSCTAVPYFKQLPHCDILRLIPLLLSQNSLEWVSYPLPERLKMTFEYLKLPLVSKNWLSSPLSLHLQLHMAVLLGFFSSPLTSPGNVKSFFPRFSVGTSCLGGGRVSTLCCDVGDSTAATTAAFSRQMQ